MEIGREIERQVAIELRAALDGSRRFAPRNK
jgi:hypothetical protein